MISPINLLGNMSEKEFTQKFWGKTPCHIGSVIENYSESITSKYLKNVIKDEQLFTKFITKNKSNYITQFGPFNTQVLNSNEPYTLLIHKSQLWHKFSYDLFNSIKFIPFFRHDDVMISFSNFDGSVGAHSDSYDVFLFQGSGEKTWLIGEPQTQKSSNSDFNVNKKFKRRYKFIAKPGDVIYIPPNTTHHGIANTDDCITYSVGFRSPSNQDIKQRYLEFLMDMELEDFDIYNDSNDNSLNIQANIPKKLIKYINEKCKSTLRNKNSSIFIGQLMSEPDLDITFIKKRYSLQQLMNNKKEQILYFDVASRGIYFDNFFFINGVHVPLTKNLFNFFKKFFDNKECCINFCKKNPELIRIIIELLNDGFIHLNSPKFKV
jgi:50S ribosomal protein L16 3-hydroxylase